jgi:gliding motility-associated-like protein
MTLQSAAQPAYEWARMLGGVAGEARGQGIVNDASGNLVLKGTFTGSLQVGSARYRAPLSDAFVAKYDVNGNVIWFKQVGFEEVEGGDFTGKGRIATDGAFNFYIAGNFRGDGDIDGNTLSSFLGSHDAYVAKYDPNGNLQWVRSLGGAGSEYLYTLAVDYTGEVYIAGGTRSDNLDFDGANVPTGKILASEQVAFFAKLNPDGSDEWIQFRRTGADQNVASALYSDGLSLFVGGEVADKAYLARINAATGAAVWESTAIGFVNQPVGGYSRVNSLQGYGSQVFAAGEFTTATLQFGGLPPMNNAGAEDMFLVTFDLNPNMVVSRSYGSPANDAVESLSFLEHDGDHILAATGYCGGSITIGPDNLPAPPPGSTLAFLAYFDVEFNSYDNPRARAVGSGGREEGLGVLAFPGPGAVVNFAAGGLYEGSLTLEGTAYMQRTPTFFFTRYDNTLTEQFGITSPKGQIVAERLIVDDAGYVYLAGQLTGTVDLYGTTLVSTEQYVSDLFVVKMERDGTVIWAAAASSLGQDRVWDLSVDAQGNVYVQALFSSTPTIAGTLLGPAEAGNTLFGLDAAGQFQMAVSMDATGGILRSIEGVKDAGGGVYIAGVFFGTFALQGYNFTSLGIDDIFLGKLTPAGVVPSAADIKHYGGSGSQQAYDLHQEAGGPLVMTGFTSGTMNFDGIPLTAGDVGLFVASFDNTLTAVSPTFVDGGGDPQWGDLITYDGAGNITVAGRFSNSADFSGILLDDPNNTYSDPFFVVSYTAAGTVRWARQILHVSDESGSFLSSLAADAPGNVYLGGSLEFSSYGDPGDLDFDGTILSHEGESDAFVAHYDPAGALQHVLAFGTTYTSSEGTVGPEYGYSFDVCPDDEIWMTGTLVAKAENFGPVTLQPYGLDDPPNTDGLDSYLVNIDFLNPLVETPKVYWTEEIGNQINRSNLDGTNFEQYYSGFSIFPQGIIYVKDGTEGIVFWTDTNGKVRKGLTGENGFDSFGDLIDESSSMQRTNLDLAVDIAGGKIYWASPWDGSVKVADYGAPVPQSTLQQVVTGLGGVSGVAFDPLTNKLYYTDTAFVSGTDIQAEIHSFTIGGGYDEIVYSEFRTYETIFFHDLELDPVNRKLYWSKTESAAAGGEIYSADLADIPGTVASFTTPGTTTGIAVDATGGKVYWVDKEIVSAEPPRIMRANLDGTGQEILREGPSEDINKPNFIALDIPAAAAPEPEIAVFVGPNSSGTPVTDGQAAAVGFGTGTQGTDIDLQFAVVNQGPGPLSITSLTALPAPYTVLIPPPATVASGATVNFTIRLSGAAPGTFTGTVTIQSNDTDEGVFDFPVSGTINAVCLTPPTATAGADQTVCAGDGVTLSGSIGGSAATSLWTTSGDGSFTNASSLATAYTPGSGDLSLGSVTLTITTDDPDGAGPCVPASDNLLVTIDSPPVVNAGADVLVCPGTVTIAGTSTAPGTVLWTSAGDGNFANAALLATDYVPGTADLASGSVTLTLSVDVAGPCPAVTDAVTLSFRQPIAAADVTRSVSVGVPDNVNVLTSATANPGDVLTVTILTQGSKGTASVRADQSVDYTANAGTVGTDAVLFRICNQCGQCDDAAINLTIQNEAPVIAPPPTVPQAVVGGSVTVALTPLLSDVNNNLDLATLKVVGTALSGASASIDASQNLVVDYSGVSFAGTDQITIEVCDLLAVCTQFVVSVEVTGEIVVYDGLSPNGDGLNDFLLLENINFLEPENRVTIYNRWGDPVYEVSNYDNASRRFEGVSDSGKELPSGTYYYKIEFASGNLGAMKGHITLRR